MVHDRATRGWWRQIARCAGWLALFCACAATMRAATVTASVDRPTIALGETVTLSLAVDGIQIGQPALPAIPNFQVVGTGSTFSFDSTRGGAQQTFTYQLSPSQIGEFIIPGLQLDTAGQQLRTQPIKIKVVKPGDAVVTPGAAAPTSFVKLVTPKTQLYVGEVSEVEVQLYWLEGTPRQYPQLPADSGFTLGAKISHTELRVNISNQLYNAIMFKQPITPVKAGALTLGPAVVPLYVPDRNRRPDIFGNRPEREVRMATDKIVIQVVPVPDQNAPATFSGAVGNYTLALTAAPTNLAAGDPITVRVKISGRGRLDALQLPPQPDWNEFKTYPPTSQIEGADPNNVSGTKSFEQVVVPVRAGIKELPPMAFSFFDPDQKAFRSVKSAAIPLTIAAASGVGSALPSLPGASNAAPAQPVSDLAHIKPYLGAAVSQSLLLRRPWFFGVQLFPPAAWLALFAWRKYRERLERDPKLRRRNEVAQLVRRGLADLRQHASAKNSEAFFATLSRLLQEQIGERIEVPANAITEVVVEERLRPGGAPEELCGVLTKLFQACNLARYAPVKSSEELSALIPELEKTLQLLRQWEPRKT